MKRTKAALLGVAILFVVALASVRTSAQMTQVVMKKIDGSDSSVISGLTIGKISKAASSTSLADSVLTESASVVTHPLGSGTGTHKLSGVFYISTTSVSNTNTSENDLMTTTLPANSLNVDGRGVRVTAWFVTTGANTKTIKWYFGASNLVSVVLTDASATTYYMTGVVVRTGSNTQFWAVQSQKGASGNGTSVGTASITDTSNATIKFTGTEATSGGGIAQKFMLVEYL